MSSPTRDLREALKSLLEGLNLGVRIYDHFPPTGVAPPCVVIQNIAGAGSEAGLGEAISGSGSGHEIRLLFQIDIYATEATKRDELADKVLFGLWSKRGELKARGIEALPAMRIQDVIEGDPGERIWRKSIDVPLSAFMAP